MRAHRIAASLFPLLLVLGPGGQAATPDEEPEAEERAGPWSLCTPFTFPDPILEPPPPGAVRTESDEMELITGGISQFHGAVALRDDERHLLADSIILNEPEQTVDAQGALLYWDNTLVIQGESAHADERAGTTSFSDTHYRIPARHARGEAKRIERLPDERTRLESMSYTTCDDGSDHWRLNASRVTLNHDTGRGTARNVRLRFMKVPFFYTPWMTFPITDERMTGLLAPSVNVDSASGSYDIELPVYLNLAPNYDATLTPRFRDDRETLLTGETRYLTRNSRGTWRGEYLDKDENGAKRYSYQIDHRTQFSRRWSGETQLEGVSDDDYRKDLGSGVSSRSERYQRQWGELHYNGNWLDARTRVETYQPVDPEAATPYQRLPQLLWSTPGARGRNRLNWGLSGEFVNFDSNRLQPTGLRQDYTVSTGYPLETSALFLRPEVRLRHTSYQLEHENETVDASLQRTVPIYSLDSGIFLERELGGPFPLIQTLEPRLYFVEVPYRDQDHLPRFDTGERALSFSNMFQPERFTGPDRVGDDRRVVTAVTTRFIGQLTGREYLTLSGGQIQYLRDREVRLNPDAEPLTEARSDFAGELTARAGDWRSSASILYDPENGDFRQRATRLQYRAAPRRLMTLQYRDRTNPVTGEYTQQQASASAIWAWNDRWHSIVHGLYDMEGEFMREGLFGFGYESCCWTTRVVLRDFRESAIAEPDRGISLELTLKGMTTLGSRLDDLFRDAILGYQPQAQ